MIPRPLSRWRTVAEASNELGIAPRTVRDQLVAGALAGMKAGRDWLVDSRDFARYREQSLGKGRRSAARRR